ncbi:MAG TPA: rhodanese-like domain-containing protein [Chloroflexia bacterium]|nr:rhodanese-like domain-containing protein [Chloroflexia bacterium]
MERSAFRHGVSSLLVLFVCTLAGCGSAAGPTVTPPGAGPVATPSAPPGPRTPAAIRRLSVAALAAALPAGRIVLLDVRTAQDYNIRRLPQARSFPLFGAAAHLGELPRDRPIVVYCA